MKVVLLKDVPKLGKKFEIKEVSDGHALNFLIPNGFAETGTEKSLKKVEVMKVKEAAELKIQEDLLKKNLKDLSGVTIEMTEKANEKGHLFAGIHKNEIIPALKAQTRLDILPEHIMLEKPIKEVGEFEIEVKVQDKIAKFKLVVKSA